MKKFYTVIIETHSEGFVDFSFSDPANACNFTMDVSDHVRWVDIFDSYLDSSAELILLAPCGRDE